ncbi:LmbE family N-acetylglucosaminyl deacetylase [Neolewinella xylanilytica]|uniref:LmbE family N-acetylglucosaminyl deacetylase n=1 Tax=Neolewinella xylanilytica TaxID=1514080 RepID=A0A2S6I281_9BACT|nr:PIG-L family deacetylase [Neolewinella xylanilytica]PPK85285.1 LmbE family N-acetylglucosaminyl deacetylase [Neolewinella xylanilytica]
MKLPIFLAALLSFVHLPAQAPARPNSGELHAAIQKLGVLGSALYIAAHPDDENTRMIAYLANVEKVETAYLSLTRGDGGQNLIAPDISELLGLTRTQELLAARRIDGGQQFFSRANDFGYSKHPDETFNIWDREQVLADAVWVIRKWRPDVMILRFDPRDPGSTHGHHTASAIIGLEAFDLAGDATAFPEQLAYVENWQPKRVYWNAYSWGDNPLPDHADSTKLIEVDVNAYLPKLGESVAEIAARSRSQHKSQGFGSSGSRDRAVEKLELLKGDDRDTEGDPFAGIDVSWGSLEGGAAIGDRLTAIEASFDFDDPAASVPDLLEVYELMQELPDGYWKSKKMTQIKDVISGALGLYVASTVTTPFATPGDTVTVVTEIANRSTLSLTINSIGVATGGTLRERGTSLGRDLAPGAVIRDTLSVVLPPEAFDSGPYWLAEDWKLGMYVVNDQRQRGLPETPDPLTTLISLMVDGQSLPLERPVRYSYTDPVAGEEFQPFEVLPPAFVEVGESGFLFSSNEPRSVTVKVTAARDSLDGTLRLDVPAGWSFSPADQPVSIERAGQERFYFFDLTPPDGQSQGRITPRLNLDGTDYDRRLVRIDHPHIPTQLATLDGGASVARVKIETAGQTVGYLPGAGDAIPEALASIGLDVDILDDSEASVGDLSQYDAIVVGVRAYNTLERMPVYQPRLLEYVKQGGTLIVQYNTNRRLMIDEKDLGPYPLQLSRDRVTVEDAPVELLVPDHPALNFPNKITAADFEGWVQERGLYFPDEWAEEYTALLSSHDPDEDPHKGGLLVAEYGSGHFVYTGYSFFRELPAGVPGAYRLFANLVALGQTK